MSGSQSHTHARGANLTSFVWQEGSTVVGEGEQVVLNLTVGVHDVTLHITDAGGNEDFNDCKVVVRGSGIPVISTLIPVAGSTTGGEDLTIFGQHFTGATAVRFGEYYLNGTEVRVLNDTAITLVTPQNGFSGTVDVVVINDNLENAESRPRPFQYMLNGVEIDFNTIYLDSGFIAKPVAVEFGPNRILCEFWDPVWKILFPLHFILSHQSLFYLIQMPVTLKDRSDR